MSAAKAVKSTAWILVAIGVGIVTGYVFGKSCAPLGNLGKFYIQLITAFAAPLLFFAVIDAIVTSEIKFKNASRFLGVVSINTIIAATIGIGLVLGLILYFPFLSWDQADGPNSAGDLDLVRPRHA